MRNKILEWMLAGEQKKIEGGDGLEFSDGCCTKEHLIFGLS